MNKPTIISAQEGYKMAGDEALKRQKAEKLLHEARMKMDVLQAEVHALKAYNSHACSKALYYESFSLCRHSFKRVLTVTQLLLAQNPVKC